MEAIAATADPTLERPPVKLLREPLFWASAFVGVVVGLAATFSFAALMVVWRGPGVLEALWLLGVPALLGRGSWALRIRTALLLAWLPVELSVRLSPILYPSLWSRRSCPLPS